MKEHPKHTRAVLIALTALCLVWLLASAVVSVPAFAEGTNPPVPPASLPADSTIITGAVTPGGGPTATDVFEIVVMFFEAVL